MTAPDLRRLLDDVAMRSTSITVAVDARLEQSIAATVRLDRHGDAEVALTRYAADSAGDALAAVLADAAAWCNERRGGRHQIDLAPAPSMMDPISYMLADLDGAGLAAVHDLLVVRQAMPAGVDAIVRVLKHGAVKHNRGDLGIAASVTASVCADHLLAHAARALTPGKRDAETGELDAAHAAARAVMLAQLVDGLERGEVG